MNTDMTPRRLFSHSTGFAAKALLCLMLAFVMILPSCSNDNSADVSDMLATVPSDASAVVAVNLKAILTKMDCKIDGSKVIPGEKMQELINNADTSGKGTANKLLSGDYGLEPSAFVFFVEGTDTYLTGSLADPQKFKAEMEKQTGEKFQKKSGDVEISGNVAVKSTRFWIHTSHNNDISDSEINRFTSLSDKLSFMSSQYAAELADLNRDMKGWANIGGLFNASDLGFTQKSMARMTIGAFFADAEDFAFGADFNDGEMVSDIRILNSKGKPAKYLYPTETIDVSALKNAGSEAQAIIGAAISSKMIEKLKEEVGSKGISMMNVYVQLLGCVNGTCAVISDSNGAINGFFTTTGEGTQMLSDALSSMDCNVSKDGKLLKFKNGEVKGDLNVEQLSPKFKGAVMGAIVSPSLEGTPSLDMSAMANYAVMLQPVEGSMQLKVTAEAIDKKSNVLFSLIPKKK